MGSMSKKDFVRAVTQQTGLAVADVNKVFQAMALLVEQELSGGRKVTIPGVGILKTVTRPARQGRNPRTGKPIEIPERNVVKLVPAKKLATSI